MINPYGIIIINISDVYNYLRNNYDSIINVNNVRPHEIEDAYDWVILEALSKIFVNYYKTNIDKHYRHDVYKCVFDYHGMNVCAILIELLKNNKLTFIRNDIVKIMVLREILVIGKR